MPPASWSTAAFLHRTARCGSRRTAAPSTSSRSRSLPPQAIRCSGQARTRAQTSPTTPQAATRNALLPTAPRSSRWRRRPDQNPRTSRPLPSAVWWNTSPRISRSSTTCPWAWRPQCGTCATARQSSGQRATRAAGLLAVRILGAFMPWGWPSVRLRRTAAQAQSPQRSPARPPPRRPACLARCEWST